MSRATAYLVLGICGDRVMLEIFSEPRPTSVPPRVWLGPYIKATGATFEEARAALVDHLAKKLPQRDRELLALSLSLRALGPEVRR